jgi:hypothetical protein
MTTPGVYDSAFFPGGTYLKNVNGIGNYPPNSRFGLFSFWYAMGGPPLGNIDMFTISNTTTHAIGINIQFRTDMRILVTLNGSDNSLVSRSVGFQSANPLPYADTDGALNAKWHHVQMFWNLNAAPNGIVGFLDGVPIAYQITSGGQNVFQVLYSVGNTTTEIGHSTVTANTSSYYGNGVSGATNAIAELFFDPINTGVTATGVDIVSAPLASVIPINVAPLAKRFLAKSFNADGTVFIYSPAIIGEHGEGVLGRFPSIYLHGNYQNFPTNHGGSSMFTTVGSPLAFGVATMADPLWLPILRSLGGLNNNTPDVNLQHPSIHTIAPRGDILDTKSFYTYASATLPGNPSQSSQGITSFWYNLGTPTPEQDPAILLAAYDKNGVNNDNFAIGFENANDGTAPLYLKLTVAGHRVDGAEYMTAKFTNPMPCDGRWHNVICTWDTSVNPPHVSAYVDSTAQTLPTLNVTSGQYANWFLFGNNLDIFYGQLGPRDPSVTTTSLTNVRIDFTWDIPYIVRVLGDTNYRLYDSGWQPLGTSFEPSTLEKDDLLVTVSGTAITITGTGTLNFLVGMGQGATSCVNTMTDDVLGVRVDFVNAVITNIQTGLRDSFGTVYGQTAAWGSSGPTSPYNEFSIAINGSITLTPVYKFNIKGFIGGGVGDSGHPAPWGASEHITGFISWYTNQNAPNGAGIRIKEFISTTFNFAPANVNTWELGRGFGAIAEVYFNVTPFDYYTAMQSASGIQKFMYIINSQAYARLNYMGMVPFGPTNRPQIYLTGSDDEFVINYAFGGNASFNTNIWCLDCDKSPKFVLTTGQQFYTTPADPLPPGIV